MSSESGPKRTSAAELRGLGFSHVEIVVATGLYSGFSPIASGTVASAVAVLLVLPIYLFDPLAGNPLLRSLVLLVLAFVATAVAIPLARKVSARVGSDPSLFTIDEFAGQWVALATPVINDPLWLVFGFFAFRLFDIAKTWPASYFDRRGGAVGIIGDDLIAGLYATISMHILWYAFSLAGLVSSFFG